MKQLSFSRFLSPSGLFFFVLTQGLRRNFSSSFLTFPHHPPPSVKPQPGSRERGGGGGGGGGGEEEEEDEEEREEGGGERNGSRTNGHETDV